MQARTLRCHHCRDHMRLLQRLAIAKSTIPNAGEGLFLAKGASPIRRRERIVLYSGDWARLLPDSNDGGPYYLQITRNLCVDAARTNTALGRWANDPKGSKDALGRPRRPNALLVAHRAGRHWQGALKASRTLSDCMNTPGDAAR